MCCDLRVNLRRLVLAIVIVSPSMQVAAEPQPIGVEIRYSVLYGTSEIGKSVRAVVRGNDGLVGAKHIVRVGPLLKLMGEDSYTQISAFRFVDGVIRPIAFEVTDESGNKKASAKFDWNDQKIRFANGGSVEIPEHSVLDWESWYVSLILIPAQNLANRRVSIVEQNRIKVYEYQQPTSQQIQYKGETVDAVKIKMQDVNDGRRSYVVWIYPQLHNIPIRIDKVKKNQKISFVATSFDWVYPE